jgi:Predicted signal transduction protein with a C-terminal ATPase domain
MARRAWRKAFLNSIQTKFVLLFIVVIAPLVAFLIYVNTYARNVVRTQVTDSYEKTLTNFINKTDELFMGAEKYLANFLHRELDTTAIDYPFREETRNTLIKVRANNKFTYMLNFMPDVDSFTYYSPQHSTLLLTTNRSGYVQKFKAAQDLMRDVAESSNIAYGTFRSAFVMIYGEQYMIRIYRDFPDVYLSAWINLHHLLESLGAVHSAILSQDDVVLASHGLPPERVEQILNDRAKRRAANPQYFLLSQYSEHQGLRYVILIPSTDVLQNLSFFQKVIYWMPAVIFIVVVFYIAFIRRFLLTPMRTLIRGMQRISHGDLDTRIRMNASNEFNYMNSVFNNMAEEIKSLKVSVYEEQLRVQLAEMKQLQMQINPHFYSNSLNLISGLAQLGDQASVQHMTQLLARYFRYVTSSSRTVLTLKEELDHIRDYLTIQQYRYPDILSFDISMPDELGSASVPPLTLQPFVENSIIHGYQKKTSSFRIRITCGTEEAADGGTLVVVTLEDNGIGVEPAKLAMLRQNVSDGVARAAGETRHLGIWNVYRRLSLMFGEQQVSIRFESVDTGGLRVMVRFPFKSA